MEKMIDYGKIEKNARIRKRVMNVITYTLLVFWALIVLFPFYWMISAATNKTLDVARGKLTFGTYAAQNFHNLVTKEPLWTALGNSFYYSILQTLLILLVCSLAGFGFELYHDKWKDRLFGILLLAMMVPQVATMIPLFKMMSSWNLLNNVWAFVLPAISTPFMIMMFRQNSRNFPVDIMEAARLDGLSEIGIFFRIYMPVMKSTYAAAAVVAFMNAWNSFMCWMNCGHWKSGTPCIYYASFETDNTQIDCTQRYTKLVQSVDV